ncbi:MAG: GIY-YIG nuclease family protein [Chlorobi bacterium]|nr:GIY-YIG nuclease family protein [Chlorobiota bacterium]
MYCVYIIYSVDFKRYYVGLSSNISQRLETHNLGVVKSTKAFCPWKIIYTEIFETRIEARKKEKYFKSAAGRRWRKKNLGM